MQFETQLTRLRALKDEEGNNLKIGANVALDGLITITIASTAYTLSSTGTLLQPTLLAAGNLFATNARTQGDARSEQSQALEDLADAVVDIVTDSEE